MTSRNPMPLDLREFLPYRLSALTNRISRGLAAMYTERFDLGIWEWRVMAVLGQVSGLSAERVCALTEMDKVSVSRAVAKLLEKGCLRRDIDASDRRRSILGLTPHGYATYARIIPLAREYEAQLLDGLSAGQRKQLFALLDRLDRNSTAPA